MPYKYRTCVYCKIMDNHCSRNCPACNREMINMEYIKSKHRNKFSSLEAIQIAKMFPEKGNFFINKSYNLNTEIWFNIYNRIENGYEKMFIHFRTENFEEIKEAFLSIKSKEQYHKFVKETNNKYICNQGSAWVFYFVSNTVWSMLGL